MITLGQIHLLDKALAELIAAGEVVERPASIAKELMENAIDAGATAIDVEIEEGGISLLRIRDNGCGIPREEIPTAFLRHATSKVSSAADLDGILTLGFRGEALASIAAMSRVELLSKTAAEEEGTLFRMEGGEELGWEPAGCPTGTVITVRDVFYNTPARMKFLKKDVGEGNAVALAVDKCALSHPEIAFRFIRDGKTRLQTSGNGELLPVIQSVYGREFASNLLPVEHAMPQEGISVTGYITSPQGAKASRSYQNFFLNRRYVRTRTAAAAMEEASKTLIGGGKFPGCVLHIDINPTLVDVNVHPAKIEVRFVNERPVFHCVYFASKSALTAGAGEGILPTKAPPPTVPHLSKEETKPIFSGSSINPPPTRMSAQEFRSLWQQEEPASNDVLMNKPLTLSASRPDIYIRREEGDPANPHTRPSSPPSEELTLGSCDIIEEDSSVPAHPEAPIPTFPEAESLPSPKQEALEETPSLRVIGELSGTYILLERQGDLLMVDKHAAHERMIYQRLKEEVAYGNRQVLLTPIPLTLAREDYDILLEHRERVEALGFWIEDFGGSSILVREVPVEMGERDVEGILGDIASKLSVGRQDLTPDVLDRLYYSIACKGALRARDKNALPELAALVDRLAEHPEITHCPHGRPVQVTLTAYDIEKLFGRQG